MYTFADIGNFERTLDNMANKYGISALDIEAQYSTKQLIEALVENRNLHVEEYARAAAAYNDRRNALFATLSRLSGDLSVSFSTDVLKQVQDTWSKISLLREPVDQREMYDQYIGLFAASTSAELTLTMSEANSIINDEWDWAVNARGIAASYTSVSKAY